MRRPALGMKDVIFAGGCLAVKFAEAVATRPVIGNFRHHGVDSSRVIGAELQHRSGGVS